jgi:vacuolar-type H+-ATPase subunit H
MIFILQLRLHLTLGKRENSFGEERGMDDKRIQQVLKIEKQAQEIHDAAVKEAQQLPSIAEQEAQALIEKAKADAQQKAREMVSKVQADDESARILSEAEEKNKQLEERAKNNFDRAVDYVLERVIGRA